MKKKILVLLGVLVCLSAVACSGSNETNTANGENSSVVVQKDTEKSLQEETEQLEATEIAEVEEETESETSEEVIYNIGDVAQLKDWEITVTDIQIADSISADYGVFEPNDEGNKYAQVFVTVTNNGKQSDTFMPSYAYGDDIYAKLLYGDGYEYVSTNLLGYDAEMHDSSINPLTQKSGEIAFEIPESVASSTDELLIRFGSGNDKISFKVR